MRAAREYLFVFTLGSVLYSFIEIVYRGRTHWSMMIMAGFIFALLYKLNEKIQPGGRLLRCLLGCFVITSLEFAAGCLLNRRLGLCVWDYSGLPWNVLGQICPGFSLAWFLLCIPADVICTYVHAVVFPYPAK